MSRKQKDDGPSNFEDRNEMMKLTMTKVATSSKEFICSFCLQIFPSAEAMDGHQRAHRSEHLEEERQPPRDPIENQTSDSRKNYSSSSSSGSVASKPTLNLLNSLIRNDDNSITGGSEETLENDEADVSLMNFFPPKELNLADRVGVHADAKGGAFNVGVRDIDLENDLTLKL